MNFIDIGDGGTHCSCMNTIPVACAFCGRRHDIPRAVLEIWSTVCPCGARGFLDYEEELSSDSRRDERGPSSEPLALFGTCVTSSTPVPVHIDEHYRRWCVCWYRAK
ncbi:MAG: hypothetical protein RRA35_11430 [Desulfomonilia bacterium]|nr:hypothetical protein [Desulfomonilia bacterium]